MSVRLGRLEGKGVVTRTPSSDDARGVLVTLTDRGAQLFDRVAPVHLRNEDVLLSALTDAEREQFAGLLHKLLVGFEHEQSVSPLGFTVAAAHVARRARAAVGLSDRAGLLVQSVEPRAERRTPACDRETCSWASGTPTHRSCRASTSPPPPRSPLIVRWS